MVEEWRHAVTVWNWNFVRRSDFPCCHYRHGHSRSPILHQNIKSQELKSMTSASPSNPAMVFLVFYIDLILFSSGISLEFYVISCVWDCVVLCVCVCVCVCECECECDAKMGWIITISQELFFIVCCYWQKERNVDSKHAIVLYYTPKYVNVLFF
jgi:hypothetical protein